MCIIVRENITLGYSERVELEAQPDGVSRVASPTPTRPDGFGLVEANLKKKEKII